MKYRFLSLTKIKTYPDWTKTLATKRTFIVALFANLPVIVIFTGGIHIFFRTRYFPERSDGSFRYRTKLSVPHIPFCKARGGDTTDILL